MFRLNFKKLFKHPGLAKYFSNTSWILFEKTSRIISSLLVGTWLVRYLGPASFGDLSYAQSYVALFVLIAAFGLDEIIIRELVNDQYSNNTILGTVFGLKLFGSFCVIVLLILATILSNESSLHQNLIIIIGCSTIFQSLNVIDSYFQSIVQSKYTAIINIISLIITNLIKIYLIHTRSTLLSFALLMLFESILVACCLLFIYVKRIRSVMKWKFDLPIAKTLFSESWLLIISGIAVSVYMKIDVVMIKNLLGTASVGKYSAAVRLSEASYFIPMVVCASLFPAIINAKRNNINLYYNRIQSLFNLMAWIGIALSIIVSLTSNWIINFLYGGNFFDSIFVLKIHVWANAFVFLGVASSKWLIVEGLTVFSFFRVFLGMITNVVLNYFFIPRYGINGAAIATLISQIVAMYLFDLFHPKTRKIFWMKTKTLFPLKAFQ